VAVTEANQVVVFGIKPVLSGLAVACRRALIPAAKPIMLESVKRPCRPNQRLAEPDTQKKYQTSTILQALCLSALTLPGVLVQAQADDSDDEVGYLFSHYEEGNRAIFTDSYGYNSSKVGTGSQKSVVTNTTTGIHQIPNQYQPITVDSEHGFGRFHLNDRTRFSFNYAQDVWSGASPVTTAFAVQGQNQPKTVNGQVTGASPGLQDYGNVFFNAQGQALFNSAETTSTNLRSGVSKVQNFVLTPTSQLQHTLGYASPEMRNQADFKFGYDWDRASVDAGAGMSIERDYQSNFGNLAGRMDFNDKLTTVNLGLSFTQSYTHAENYPYLDYGDYSANQFSQSSGVGAPFLNGNRVDEAITLAISQVINKNAVLTAGFGYTQSRGYMANPYKGVTLFELLPGVDWRSQYNLPASAYPGVVESTSITVAERRPNLRNQLTWDTSYLHYIEPLNAAGKLGYSFFHDDWGINAHTFEGEWRQSVGSSWTITPNVRYYSQSAASFYAPYFFVNGIDFSSVLAAGPIPQLYGQNFSSDQRLSAYGTLSGGITLSKQFAKGLSLDLGLQYYTHASALTLGGGGSGDYMDFHYYVANAALRANFNQLAKVSGLYDSGSAMDWLSGLFDPGSEDEHAHHHNQDHPGHQHRHGSVPAGVMFASMMDEGEYMVGYRYMRDTQGGALLNGSQPIAQQDAKNQNLGCYNSNVIGSSTQKSCGMYPTYMTMNMQMLDLMYAPTDWLNLMVMPQFVNMDMQMLMPNSTHMANGMGAGAEQRGWQTNGGFGDTSIYALFKLWEGDGHHLHLTQGISAPTGSINIKTEMDFKSGILYPYDMQNGSGTWDYKPSLTYTGRDADWFWGGQLSGTKRLQQYNSLGYSLGDILQGTAWSGYQVTNWLSGTVRGIYTQQGAIKVNNSPAILAGGLSSSNTANSMPDSFPQNYGGSFGDVGFGVTVSVPNGKFAGNALSFEWLQPVYTDYNGVQLARSGALAATWSYGF